MDKDHEFDRLLTYKIEYSDAIVDFENSQEEYINAFSYLSKINVEYLENTCFYDNPLDSQKDVIENNEKMIIKLNIDNTNSDGRDLSFKNSINLAKKEYDNKLNNLRYSKEWLNNLENKIMHIENKILNNSFS